MSKDSAPQQSGALGSAFEQVMQAAMNMAHVYAFVGDDSLPIAKRELERVLRAALAVEQVEPVAWLIFRAGQHVSPDGGVEADEWLEVAYQGAIGDDDQSAFPVYRPAHQPQRVVGSPAPENGPLVNQAELPASLPAPVGEPSDAHLMHLWDTHVGDFTAKYPFGTTDAINFARAVLALRPDGKDNQSDVGGSAS